MKASSLIGHVAELHTAVMAGRQPADRVTAAFFAGRRYLGSRERRFVSDTLYGMLRQERLLEALASSAMTAAGGAPRTPVPSLVLYAVYALRMQGIPPEQITDDLGALWAAFVRTPPAADFLREAATCPVPDMPSPAERLALLHTMPGFLTEEWVERYGADDAEALCAALNTPAPTVIRTNTLRGTRETLRDALAGEGLQAAPTAISPSALRVERRFHAESLGSFRAGLFELQDEASQVAGFLASPAPGSRVLDFCAGGGGKTLHLAALMDNRGELFARDVSEKRLGDIRQRVLRSGAGIVRVLPAAGAQELPAASMDLVLVDAPCSGAGTFRRNPAAKLFLTREACARHEAAQRAILAQAAPFVRSGGRLVYCTCTLRRAENEEVIAGFLAAHAEWTTVSAAGELSRAGVPTDTAEPFLSLLPHRHGTDGFFGAVFRRA